MNGMWMLAESAFRRTEFIHSTCIQAQVYGMNGMWMLAGSAFRRTEFIHSTYLHSGPGVWNEWHVDVG